MKNLLNVNCVKWNEKQKRGNGKSVKWNATTLHITHNCITRLLLLLHIITLHVFVILCLGANVIFGETVKDNHTLRCKITVPAQNSIIRGDVPIYGYAYGEGFKEYRLEYGTEENPKEWILISTSTIQQQELKTDPKIDLDLVKTIPGNLGMWETGLTEYRYKESPVDLPMGIYTLRLTAFDTKGKRVDDRTTVEVGRVLVNCMNSSIESTDKKVCFTLPEHSLIEPVAVISLKAVRESEGKFFTPIYELSPPGLTFTRESTLKFFIDGDGLSEKTILVCDPESKKWIPLKSFYDEKNKSIETYITAFPEKFALYTVGSGSSFPLHITQLTLHNSVYASNWENRNGIFGAKVEIFTKEDNSKCLKLTNQMERGSFAVVRKGTFNAQQYAIISFDYKIPSGVKVNLFAKVNNVWYDIIFSDDKKVYWNINMEKIGSIENVQADNQWHHAEINLYEMLKNYYHDKYIRETNYIVQELMFANWDSTGFMKLEFGQNPVGASWYLDNFEIKK